MHPNLCLDILVVHAVLYVEIFRPVPGCYLYVFHAGMFAIRAEREYVENEDLMKAVRKVSETKKLESKLDYKQI